MIVNKIGISLLLLMLGIGDAQAQNLVQNGSAELFDAANMQPLYWSILSGYWVAHLPGSGYASTTYDGDYFFFPGAHSPDTLQQDVDVSSYASAIDASHKTFSFSAYVQSYDQGVGTSDQTQIIVQCLNGAKTDVLHTFDSDTMSSLSTWTPVSAFIPAPPGTRYVRILLIAARKAGSDNDGYFDAVNLSIIPVGINSTGKTKKLIYPNPATDVLNIEGYEGAKVTIRDITGRLCYNNKIDADRQAINIGALVGGVYTVSLEDITNGERITSRILKE